MKAAVCVSIILLLFNRCSVYQKGPISVEKAYNQGEGKVIYTSGVKQNFSYISLEDSIYYINVHEREKVSENQYAWMEYRKEVDSTTVSGFFVRKKKEKPYKIKIIFQGKSEAIKGYLYAATDSSIIIIPNNNKAHVNDGLEKVEIPVFKIKKIEKSVKKAAATGFISGFLVGSGFGIFLSGLNPPSEVNTGTYVKKGLGFGLLFGTGTSMLSIMLTRKVYTIDGDITKYRAKYLGTLQIKSNTKSITK